MFYDWLKALHLIAVISWMAGMLYLPRLYVYHADAKVGGEFSEGLKVMERRLLRFIINPAMCAAVGFGLMMIADNPEIMKQPYMHAKLTLVLLMLGVQGVLAKYRKAFGRDERPKSAKFFRILNEVPTVLMIGIVILIVVKPF